MGRASEPVPHGSVAGQFQPTGSAGMETDRHERDEQEGGHDGPPW